MRSLAWSMVVGAGLGAACGGPASALIVSMLTGAREMCTRARNVAQGVQQARRSCMNDSPALRTNGFGAMETIVVDFAPDTAVFTTRGDSFTDFDDASAAGHCQWGVTVDVTGLVGGGSADAGVDATLPFTAGEPVVMRFVASGGAAPVPDAAITLTDGSGVVVGATTIGFAPGATLASLIVGAPGAYTLGVSWTGESGPLPDGASMYASGQMRIDWSFEAPSCAADFNGDGHVGAADLAILLGAWGTSTPSIDLDGNGVVNASDLAALLGSWGSCQ